MEFGKMLVYGLFTEQSYGKMMNTKIQRHTFIKKIGQTLYRFDIPSTKMKRIMQKQIKQMLVVEAG